MTSIQHKIFGKVKRLQSHHTNVLEDLQTIEKLMWEKQYEKAKKLLDQLE